VRSESKQETYLPNKRQKVDDENSDFWASKQPSVGKPENIDQIQEAGEEKKANTTKRVATPKTCASSKVRLALATPAERALHNEDEDGGNNSGGWLVTEKSRQCFKNLSQLMNEADEQPQLKSEQNAFAEDPNHVATLEDDVFSVDFDTNSIFQSSSFSLSLEDLAPINAVVKQTSLWLVEDAFSNNFIPMGDGQLPLCMQY